MGVLSFWQQAAYLYQVSAETFRRFLDQRTASAQTRHTIGVDLRLGLNKIVKTNPDFLFSHADSDLLRVEAYYSFLTANSFDYLLVDDNPAPLPSKLVRFRRTHDSFQASILAANTTAELNWTVDEEEHRRLKRQARNYHRNACRVSAELVLLNDFPVFIDYY